MKWDKLDKNLKDMLMEQQAKIGFLPETVRLYYPLDSLNRLLEADLDEDEMFSALSVFGADVADSLGGAGIRITREKDRFCLILPPELSKEVHASVDPAKNADYRFILAFVETISQHDCTIEQLTKLFEAHADSPEQVHVEACPGEDFDYLFYFANGKPDSYRYCVTCEGPHLIYHRYTPEDYAALMGN